MTKTVKIKVIPTDPDSAGQLLREYSYMKANFIRKEVGLVPWTVRPWNQCTTQIRAMWNHIATVGISDSIAAGALDAEGGK